MKGKLFSCFILLFSQVGKGQPAPGLVRGVVTDSVSGKPLEEATLSIFNQTDRKLLRQIHSTRRGFQFRLTIPGSYIVVTSYIGYRNDTIRLALTGLPEDIHPLNIALQPSASQLMEVIVRASIPPAIVRNDTIAFNAGAFATRPHATVEDLLKKMPGISVDKDGNVTIQGRKVDKIYLDGKEFFLNDLRTATRNLPADMVSQIEVFDTQTDQGKLTGVPDPTGAKTVNIKLKKDRKKEMNGKAYGGLGNGDAYTTGASVTCLAGNRWLVANLQSNNINNQFTGDDNQGGAGAGQQTNTNLDVNYRQNWDKSWELTAGALYAHNSLKVSQNSTRQTFFVDSSMLENRTSSNISSADNYRGNLSVTHNMDSMTMLIYKATVNVQSSDTRNRDSVDIRTLKSSHDYQSSAGLTDNESAKWGYDFSNSLNIRRRFKKDGRILLLLVESSSQHEDADAKIFSAINGFDSAGNISSSTHTDQKSSQLTTSSAWGASISYTEPITTHRLLDFHYRIGISSGRSAKNSADYNSATGQYDQLDSLTSNSFANSTMIQRLGMSYNVIGGKWRYQLGTTVQLTDLRNNNYSLKSKIDQHNLTWFPRASLLWSVAKNTQLEVRYAGNTVTPTIAQLQPVHDLSNPFLSHVGNPDLKPEFNHSLGLTYKIFDSRSLQNVQVSLWTGLSINHIAEATTLLPAGVQQVEAINTNGVHNLSAEIAYGFPLWKQKGTGFVSLHGALTNDRNMINGDIADTRKREGVVTLSLNYHPAKRIFIDATGSLDYNGMAYSLSGTTGSHSLAQNYSISASYELPWATTVSTYYNEQATGGTLPATAAGRWNASLYKSFLKNHSLELRLSVFDLLNSNKSVWQSSGINFIQTSTSNVTGRLVLVSLIFRLEKFPI